MVLVLKYSTVLWKCSTAARHFDFAWRILISRRKLGRLSFEVTFKHEKDFSIHFMHDEDF